VINSVRLYTCTDIAARRQIARRACVEKKNKTHIYKEGNVDGNIINT
jgi:hypothetical protein